MSTPTSESDAKLFTCNRCDQIAAKPMKIEIAVEDTGETLYLERLDLCHACAKVIADQISRNLDPIPTRN